MRNLLGKDAGLYTDMYELTMAQGYFLEGRKDHIACFDYFFRDNPFGGGYVAFSGLEELLSHIAELGFSDEAITYLKEEGFHDDFLEHLKNFKFKGEILSMAEGEIVFPEETILQVRGDVIETQILETMILNFLNFNSLISTKASRIRSVAKDRMIADFGLRRAQGIGGIQASTASIIGGVDATSNVYSGKEYGIPITGTQAHSWIQSFDTELEAFRTFARIYPERSILLVDTYDTLGQGVPNAIKVGKELEEKGKKLKGIRLDSGDLAYLSKKARKMLDDAGLDHVLILASNQLDEYVIRSLNEQGAPIDGFGVGTRLITGMDSGALDGVYKMSMYEEEPRIKLSENIKKVSLPGRKQVLRYFNEDGSFYGDGIILEGQEYPKVIHHPHFPEMKSKVENLPYEELLKPVMKNGEKTLAYRNPKERSEYLFSRAEKLPLEHRRFEYPHTYKVGISPELLELRTKTAKKLSKGTKVGY